MTKRRHRTVLGICIAAVCSLALAPAAMADFTVNDLGDQDDANFGIDPADGVCDTVAGGTATCTLRAAIEEANGNANADTITFSVTGLHTAGNVYSITTPMTIDGNGSSAVGTVIDGLDSNRLLLISGAATPVTLKDLRLQNGHVANPSGGGDGGAAVKNDAASLALDNVTVTSNTVDGTGVGQGAGIFDPDTADVISLTDSTVSNNDIGSTSNNNGAGIYSSSSVSLTDSTVSGNQITAGTATGGGGLQVNNTLTLLRSTVSGNQLVSGTSFGTSGGGISTANATITNSTISGNGAGNGGSGEGGGMIIAGAGTITNATFANNSASVSAADLSVQSGTTTVRNSIFASSDACIASGTLASATPGDNIDVGTTCGLGTTNGNLENTSPTLDPLALNAPGTTATHALQASSPAIDEATGCAGLTVDQRGAPRPQGLACDIGAYERLRRKLTVGKAGTGTGTVTGTGIACGLDCLEGFEDGTTGIVLTASPGAGSAFTSWSGCTSVAGNQCTVDLTADKAVTATFTSTAPPPPGGGGTTTQPPATTTANPLCASLHKKLKKAKSKAAKRKIRKKLRKLGC
jgi:hypothetical protein